MALVVPFDGSQLSKTALVRAAQFDTVLDEGVLAVTAIPSGNAEYARERGWLDDGESFDGQRVVEHLRGQVHEIAPDTAFEHIVVSKYAQAGEIAQKLRSFARSHDAGIVFIGSENAGRIARSISVGGTVATDRAYDTMLVSHVAPSRIPELEATLPTDDVVE